MYILTSELEQEVSMMKSYDKRTIVCPFCFGKTICTKKMYKIDEYLTIDTDILPARETYTYRFTCISCHAVLNFNRSLDLKYEYVSN